MDIKQEVEEESEIMDEIVNDIKTMNDHGHAKNEEDTAADIEEKSLNRIVKKEFDSDISFNETEASYSFENIDESIALKTEEENDINNSELDNDSDDTKDFITDASVKMEAEMYRHTDDSLDIGGNEDSAFDIEYVDNDFISGKGAGIYTGSDDSGKEVDKDLRELSDYEVDYDHETDSYDEEEYEGIVIKKEKSEDFEEETSENLMEDKDPNIDYGRKTKKAKKHVCDLCSKAFTSDNRLKRHKKQLHPDGGREEKPTKEGKYLCEVCNKRFISQSRLRLHTVTHTGEKPFSCDFCDQKFSHPTNKRRHMKTHTGDKPFICMFCGKSFPVKHYLKDHMVKHTGEKPHECKLCFMTFAHRFSLKQHELLKHPGGEVNFKDTYQDRPFSCEICGKKFTQQSSLKIHVRLHTGAKPYKCTECEASFIRSDSLLRHKFEHSGQRPFRCDMCDKAFTSAYILKQHRNVHTGDRRQQCEHCGVELANKESLARHMMRHTGESLPECKTCHKKFISDQSLKRHRERPCEEKIHECKYCDYKNISESKLKRHMLKHNAQKLLECKICKNKFTYPSNLKRHMKVHEKDHEKKAKKQETLISNDDVGNFIAESMKDIEADKSEEMIPLSKKTKKKDNKTRADSDDAVELLCQTEEHEHEFELSNKSYNFDDTNENLNTCIDDVNKFQRTDSDSIIKTEVIRSKQANGYPVDELKQKVTKDVKMKAFYTLQYYDYVARLKGQDETARESSLERTDIKTQKIDDNLAERNTDPKGVHGNNVQQISDVVEKPDYAYACIDEKQRVTHGIKSEECTEMCDNQKIKNQDDISTCQSLSCDSELSQNRLIADNLSFKSYEPVDTNYRTIVEYQQRKEGENIGAPVSEHSVATDWNSFGFHVPENSKGENESLSKFSLKLPAVSSTSYSSLDSKMLPLQDVYNSVPQTQYSAVPYKPALFSGRLPAFAGSFYAQHHVSAPRSTIPTNEVTFETETLQPEALANISVRNQTLVQDVLKRLYSHQRGDDESYSSNN